MYRLPGQLLCMAVGLFLTSTAATSSAALKCSGGAKQALYAIDGVINGVHTDSSLKHFDMNDVWGLDIVCMNPEDSTFRRRGPGISVVSIWTVHGPAPQLEPTLAAIVDAQDARARAGLDYAGTLDELNLRPAHSAISVSLDVEGAGWMATATAKRYLRTCFVFDGDVSSTEFFGSPRAPTCREDD